MSDVMFEFVDPPALNGENVEWTFRTCGGATAPAGTVTTQIAVMSSDNRLLGGGSNSLGGDLGPDDLGGGQINPVQYTAEDGDYQLSITVGGDVRYVAYRVQDRHVSAI